MTTNVDLIGASLAKPQVTWSKLKWPALKGNVFRLQVRIAKADKEGRHGKVRALQRLLTSLFSAKCLAIKRVTSSPGSKTPGVDGKTLRTDQQKGSAILALKRHGYKPQALRRIYIPKKSNPNEQRALSIPTIIDRGQQALHLLSNLLWKTEQIPMLTDLGSNGHAMTQLNNASTRYHARTQANGYSKAT